MPECDLNAELGLGLGLAQIFSVAGTFRRHTVHQMIRHMPPTKLWAAIISSSFAACFTVCLDLT